MSETWIICRHVMDGTAEKVTLKKDKICLCSICAEDIEIINTEEVYILDEERLEYTLQKFEYIEGLENLDRSKNQDERVAHDQRSGKDRRLGDERRSEGATQYNGPERRNLKYRRSGVDRRSGQDI